MIDPPKTKSSTISTMPRPAPQRLVSLDFMRGLIMILLMLESTHLYQHLYDLNDGSALQIFFLQFFHHPWNGLRFWDLVQPGFMFIAGTAMAYSLQRQQLSGMAWSESFLKTFKRSAWLFFWGVLDYAVRPHGLSFELWDVLTQLSFTTLIAFFIFRWSYAAQVIFSLGLLLLTEILYRYTNIPGFDQPFTDQHNFGNYMDLLLMNKINAGGWVAINCIPTAAHTIWGVLAGKMLLSEKTNNEKIKWFLLTGLTALVVGFGLNVIVTPIIKKIATSTFVLASGGWCLLALCLFYWWIDVKNHKNGLYVFQIVGMNSLFIYLFFEIVGSRWLNDYIGAITNGIMGILYIPDPFMFVITSLTIFALEWKLCEFLYKKGIFFKV